MCFLMGDQVCLIPRCELIMILEKIRGNGWILKRLVTFCRTTVSDEIRKDLSPQSMKKNLLPSGSTVGLRASVSKLSLS